MKLYIAATVTALLLFSCSTKKIITTTPEKNTFTDNKNIVFKNINQPVNFSQIKINSKVDIQNGSFIPTLDATIYIENGNKVWMNISALFLNVARGIATPSGIKGYEKWNKTYIDSDFTYLNKLLNVDFINYNALQNILLGKAFIPITENNFEYKTDNENYVITSKENQIITTNGKTSEYKTSLEYSHNFNLQKVIITDVKKNEGLEIYYDNWVNENNLNLPKNVKIIIKKDKTSQILIENTTFAFSEMNTPYSVPANYTKTEIR